MSQENIQNTPCLNCQNTEYPLHTNGLCGYCWDEENQLVDCRNCIGGRWETECCSGANNCDCRGQVIDMGRCNVCQGTGKHKRDANTRANIETIQGRCFIGRGPTSGYWAGK